MNSNISLSTVANIENDIQRTVESFSTVNTMGSLINNVKFKQGYDEFALGQTTERSYIWNALSAISENLGQTLYQNVKDYIDNVSNVDTCKVRALKSMMYFIGCDYNVLDKIGYYPIEIQNLIDILSINKKYLLSNKYIKQDFLDSLCADHIASVLKPEQQLYPYYMSAVLSNDQSVLSIDAVSSSNDLYVLSSSAAFDSYLSSIFENFIYDMLQMHGTGLYSDTVLYKTGFLSDVYGPDVSLEDKYLQKKKILNVDVNFDVEQIVNDIDIGIDSLDNYSGCELSLLVEEIDFRKSPADGLSCLDLATRNIYYRKQKVVEYAEFVDNMVFLPVNFSSYVEYPYDKDYLTMLSNAQHHTCIVDLQTSPRIVSSYVEYAAMALAEITKYITKIRETIKLQARKIFMKGTNNLLMYTANEFMIDYINQLKSCMPYEKISAFVEKLSAHSIKDVSIQEYWDLTEYMNLSTITTKYSTHSSLANDRFFDNTFERINDQLIPDAVNIFTNEDLNHFYLDQLGLANTLYPAHQSKELMSNLSSNLYEFLSVLFDIGANTSYYNQKSKFGMKLPNNVITEEIDNDLLSVKYISSFISDALVSTGYQFNDSTSVVNQINEFSQEVYNVVQTAEREGISSTYDSYHGTIDDISGMLDSVISEFGTMLNETYASYFCKSTSMYCYDINGNYMFDYFVGNIKYSNDNSFAISAQNASAWINDDHCYTFALSTVIENLSGSYDRCYTQLTNIIDESLEKLDFINPDSADLAVDMDSMQTFVNTKIQQRNTYLQNILDDLKSQASQAKQEHETMQATFSSILASLPNLPHQAFYMQGAGLSVSEDGKHSKLSGTHELVDPMDKSHDLKISIYDAVSQARYRETKKYGTFLYVSSDVYLDEKFVIDESDSFESSIEKCIQLVDFVNTISFGASTSTVRTTGTQKMTLQSLQTGINRIKSLTLPSIVNQLKEIFNVEVDTDELFGSKTCIEQIEGLISYLNTNVSEQQFNGDSIMRSYYEILNKINNISCNEYVPAKSQYDAMWTDFEAFFNDFAKGSDYMSFIPSNISAVNEYRQKKDAIALNSINEQMTSLNDRYLALLQQFIDMCTYNKIKLYDYDMKLHRYLYTGNSLEYCLVDFADKILTDIEIRDQIANLSAEKAVEDVQKCVELTQELYQKYFPRAFSYVDQIEYIQKFNAMTTSFMSIIDEIAQKLEYSDEYEYVYSKDLFKNYSGLTSVATDPYYNIKNQTHPSYQIHPFMWNFIEYHALKSTLEQMSNSMINLNFDLLEASKALSAIDSMLGKFGNVVDVWKHNTKDFTGYITKYEQSNHICEYTGKWSEVVGYEGAFYPPVISAYMGSSKSTVDSLHKYYDHLNLDANPILKARINSALSSSYTSIRTIAWNRCTKAQMYDIYKYYVDAYENEYILYKNYNDENPSEQKKLETAGQLWIRLAHSPIAFEYRKIIDVNESNSFTHFASRIYDICVIDSGTRIIITGYATESKTQIQSRAFYIKYNVEHLCGVGNLAFVSYNPAVSYGYQDKQSDLVPSIQANVHYKYIGCMNSDESEADIVYIECMADGSIPDNPVVHIWPIRQEEVQAQRHIKQKIDGIHDITGLPVISYHEAGSGFNYARYVDIMFAASGSSTQFMTSQHKDLSVGTIDDAQGAILDNISHEQMNSLDLISNKLALVSIAVEGNSSSSSKRATLSQVPALQINTDMGYIPSYTYGKYENVLDIKHDLDSSYQMVELLGKSKDIEGLIESVNEDTDPYVTKKSLFDKYMYGRIYEDDGVLHQPNVLTSVSSLTEISTAYPDFAWDNSINIYSSYSMYQNMPSEYIDDYYLNYVNGHYQWTILLGKKYSYEKLRKLRLFIYSTASLGRNPYVVAEMSDVIDMSLRLDENAFLSTNYSDQRFDVATYSFVNGVFNIAVNGTQNGINEVDAQFSNALPNIADFTYKFSTLGGGMYLKLDLKLKDINAGGYIGKDTIKVALVDMHDLSFYNWCHFLDPGITFGEYQYIVNRLSGIPLATDQLLNIDFSEYNYLSDIQVNGMQIFSTNRHLQFKVDESDVFVPPDFKYYVPCLNIKYPLTFAQAFDQLYNIPDDQLYHMVHMYDSTEIFEIEVADANLLSTIQSLNMKFTDVVDDFRVFEDYYDVESDGIDNNTRYALDDPYFYQYVHFVSPSDGVQSDTLSVDDSACTDVRIDGTDAFSMQMRYMGVDPRHGEMDFDDQQFTRYLNFSSMSYYERQKFIQHMRKYMRLYISYDKVSSGIVLYVNYQNYVNSPYVKLVDGLMYSTTIDNTYLKVFPDESGLIDIVIQFKQYINGVLMGIDNITVATCKIYNVSDDKPKFIIERISQLH